MELFYNTEVEILKGKEYMLHVLKEAYEAENRVVPEVLEYPTAGGLRPALEPARVARRATYRLTNHPDKILVRISCGSEVFEGNYLEATTLWDIYNAAKWKKGFNKETGFQEAITEMRKALK